MAVERRLTELVGPVGGKVHTGRSRNDQVALDLQLYLRSAVSGHQAHIARAHGGPARPGREARGRDLPGLHPSAAGATGGARPPSARLLLRPAAGLGALRRLARHLLDAARRRSARRAPTTSSTGTWWPPSWASPRSLPTPWTPSPRGTPRSLTSSIAANCALTLSRLAEELVLWSTQEFGLASLPESWTSGSSIMPQKRNPDAAELVRAKAAGFLARLQGMGVLLKGLPLAYNKDLQEDKLYVFGTKEELDLCLQAMTAMIEGLTFDAARAREAAEGGYAAATDVADYLVGKGLPFRDAHRVAGQAGGPAGRRTDGRWPARRWRSCGTSARCSTRTSTRWWTSSGWWAARCRRAAPLRGGWPNSWRWPGRFWRLVRERRLALARPRLRRSDSAAMRCPPGGSRSRRRSSSPAPRTRWPPISSARSCGARPGRRPADRGGGLSS